MKRSTRHITTAAVVVASLAIGATVALPAPPESSAERPGGAAPGPRGPCATRVWVLIAGDLKETVPAKILLGGPGASPALDERLAIHGIARAAFQRTARAVRAEVMAERDESSRDAVAASVHDFPLPEGWQVVEPRGADEPDEECDEAARDLVLELTALSRIPTTREEEDDE